MFVVACTFGSSGVDCLGEFSLHKHLTRLHSRGLLSDAKKNTAEKGCETRDRNVRRSWCGVTKWKQMLSWVIGTRDAELIPCSHRQGFQGFLRELTFFVTRCGKRSLTSSTASFRHLSLHSRQESWRGGCMPPFLLFVTGTAHHTRHDLAGCVTYACVYVCPPSELSQLRRNDRLSIVDEGDPSVLVQKRSFLFCLVSFDV